MMCRYDEEKGWGEKGNGGGNLVGRQEGWPTIRSDPVLRPHWPGAKGF